MGLLGVSSVCLAQGGGGGGGGGTERNMNSKVNKD